jgi:hypothetical protein
MARRGAPGEGVVERRRTPTLTLPLDGEGRAGRAK